MPDYKGNISQVYNLLKTNGATNQSEADFARVWLIALMLALKFMVS
jgi:hypothetical protein